MDARVNDFLNEINEIAPLSETKEECVWEKCFDEESGYYYYWNTKTNAVTWDVPSEYKPRSKTKKPVSLYIPPRTAPLFPSTSSLLPPVSDAIKIYKIGECTSSLTTQSASKQKQEKEISHRKEEKLKQSLPETLSKDKLEEEKIVLISSYGGDSESEEEIQKDKLVNDFQKSNMTTPTETDSELNVLDKAVECIENEVTLPQKVSSPKSQSKEISGFSLVAGYSDSEEEEVETEPQIEKKPVAHSTLFPIPQTLDPKDFEEDLKSPQNNGDFDTKAFQRKKRIGVALINTGKKVDNVEGEETERKGLGFSGDSNNKYSGFKSGGVMFVKADVLIPSNNISTNASNNSNITNNNSNNNNDDIDESKSDEKVDLKGMENAYLTLKEKLGFLSEGREEVSPVQVMLIQLETLYTALKAGDLKYNYLRKWLDDTCSDLVKLEKEATPEGWLLQWDRSHKRYYYQNESTGESQWEYPQSDVTRCDEAMDICTTPPPCGVESNNIHVSPPLPPVIRSPSPPPPPTISDSLNDNKKCDIPLPPETKEDLLSSNEEPLPPGIDTDTSKDKVKITDDLKDALNSFYSDLAAIENSNSPPPAPNPDEVKTDSAVENLEPAKKKKKTKVKLAQGIAMKKKGVSKLVEKWKNVQLSYNE